jgi:hypothetical protein
VLSRAEASQGTIGTIGFTGDAHKGSLSVSCPGVESLLLRLRGPAVLPDLRGGLDLHLSYQHGEAGLDLAIDRARLTRTELRLGGGELLREVTTDLRGTIQVRPEAVVVRAGGQLRTGELFVSPSWLPLAAQTPIGSVEVRILPGAVVELAEVLVRAADAQGQPLPGGYSCQFSGRLAGDPVTGQVQGVIDHADLSWFASRLGSGDARIAGEGAIAIQAQIGGPRVIHRITGTFLPLGTDLSLDNGRLQVRGITGGIRFSYGED